LNFGFRISDFEVLQISGLKIRHSTFDIPAMPKSEIPTMLEPEIARRCLSCGVSIRVRASFCPQCGKKLTPKPDASKGKDAGAATPGSAIGGLTADASSAAATKPLKSEKTTVPPPAVSSSPSAPRKQPMQATVGMVHHAGPPSREALEDDGLHRVEKFRQISSAVIDEATYDPSLRFVLIAVVLFVLFLFLLLLSELIT
jgi:hypothetical protein